jgi:UDP-3-O-[3-hydroxymyristoyl] N-acetylglucosamine deacetylase
MAALAGAGIDNARIEIDGPELPILDGSAAPFLFLIDCAGVVAQPARRGRIEVLRPIRVSDGDSFIELLPEPGLDTLEMSMSIDFDAPAIGRQALSLALTENSFRGKLAQARTFALARDVARLHEAGLARGGSLDNAVVVDGAKVLNPAGLRMADEFVRHKLLDAVGDLALAGAPIAGRFVAHRSGHALNNQLLRALFADATAWRRVGTEAPETAEMAWGELTLSAA